MKLPLDILSGPLPAEVRANANINVQTATDVQQARDAKQRALSNFAHVARKSAATAAARRGRSHLGHRPQAVRAFRAGRRLEARGRENEQQDPRGRYQLPPQVRLRSLPGWFDESHGVSQAAVLSLLRASQHQAHGAAEHFADDPRAVVGCMRRCHRHDMQPDPAAASNSSMTTMAMRVRLRRDISRASL